MKKRFTTATALAGMAACAGFAQAQDHIITRNEAFQQAVVLSSGSGNATTMVAGAIGPDGRMGLLNVPGKPFSALETRQSVQTLANGAKIEHSDSNLFYRDDQGRTRAEQSVDGRKTIVIMDPVAHQVTILNPGNKTARRMNIPSNAQFGGATITDGAVSTRWGTSTSTSNATGATTFTSTNSETHASAGGSVRAGGYPVRVSTSSNNQASEDLGMQTVNGVMAHGTRDTLTIPAQSIGNDRDLQVVDERWFSNDLQMLVKSTNTDPRFGQTSYQLTNIQQGSQDPNLFTVPADYTISADNFKIDFQTKVSGK